MNIHVHIYDQQPALVFDDNLIEEIDLEEIDQYDDYIQYVTANGLRSAFLSRPFVPIMTSFLSSYPPDKTPGGLRVLDRSLPTGRRILNGGGYRKKF